MTSCNYCSDPITFDDYHISERGKKIPLDLDTGEPHHCTSYRPRYNPRPVECYKCGGMITFDDQQRSRSGKMIPLNWSGRQPHDCPDDKQDDYE